MRLSTLLSLIVISSSALMFAADDQNGAIKARGTPTGAGLFVNGKYIGPAGRFSVPEKYSVAAGEVEVAFRDPRYEEFVTKATIKPGKTTKLHYHLKKITPPQGPFGRLRFGGGEAESFISVAAGDTSPVYINDRFMGFLDELNNKFGGLLLPPGEYTFRCSSPLFGDINQKVTLTANKTTIVQLKKGL
ncbi:MAG: PEGA domain-containing protein [Acidobacteria bacterium]|nr:PEGA domain-containing protein [Acidobacteriota bacterium]